MLAGGGVANQLPAAIVVGRTLATPSTAASSTPSPSYFVGEVQGNQVTIIYTAYNEQANAETGVLITTTLQPGVTFVSSTVTLDGVTTTQLPDRSGQSLAWSLAPINGFDRESVAVTVNLPALGAGLTTPTQLDTGAHVYATLNAGAVSNTTPPAALQPGNPPVDANGISLLAPPLDPNDPLAAGSDANDPFIQEEAAKLSYDPTQIFNYLHTQIGYNSYTGSLRGARGTLWSNAGNALDVANLGVALMRASGIPAQYVSGTLSQSQAQQLILSMFPASFQTVGYIPASTQVSDPANDPQLLSETESHYWFQFDAGSGMEDADPLMAGATIGQTFTASTGTFTAIPQSLRETTTIQLVAEFYSQASALFGLSSGLQDTTITFKTANGVPINTFNDAELVGRPLTIGNFVNNTSLGAIFTEVTNTYSPYIEVGDDANPDPSHDEIIPGTAYQEVLTDFPFGSQILTGLFLDVTLSGPLGAPQTFSSTLFDRIGYAARQSGGSINVTVDASAAPAISSGDSFTVDVLPSIQATGPITTTAAALQSAVNELDQATSSGDTMQTTGLALLARTTAITGVAQAMQFYGASDAETRNLDGIYGVVSYADRPRIAVSKIMIDGAAGSATTEFDVLNDALRVIVAPGQAVGASFAFNVVRGMLDNAFEQFTAPPQPGASPVNTTAIIAGALGQGIPLLFLTSSNASALDGSSIPADARARIASALAQGLVVIAPASTVALNGTPAYAWYEMDPSTGAINGVVTDGAHADEVDYTAVIIVDDEGNVTIIVQQVQAAKPFLEKYLEYLEEEQKFAESLKELKKTVANFDLGATIAKWLHVLNPEGSEFLEAAFVFLKVAILLGDPPIAGLLSSPDVTPVGASINANSLATTTQTISANPSLSGNVAGSATVPNVALSGPLTANWNSSAIAGFALDSINVATAVLTDSHGNMAGSGAVNLQSSKSVSSTISGNNRYIVSGQGSLSFYGPAESSLGVSGDWQNYTATVTGDVSITLTVPAGALTLNGTTLPAGTYTITTSSASLSGSGTTSSPTFSGEASITATNGTLNLGPGSGTLSVGGKPLDPENETTLDGYTGTTSVSANGDGTDSVSLNGNAGNVLQVSTTPSTLTTDQNTPVTFATNVQTSLADTYNITANAPPGWTVSIDSSGNVTVTPASGLQSGTYPIQIIAQSQTDANLVAQTTIDVTITPTQPGINLTVASDPIFTVPFNGAQLPTAFRASIQNLGPAADTYNLTFSNVPTGFTILDSGTSVTVPAGQTGILGIYLQPNTGQPIPPPGTQLSFTVTATSTTDSSITQTQTETFTVPEIDAVTVTGNPSSVNTTPGTPVSDTITLTNAGNVPETVSLAETLPSGLTASALTPASLAVGQSTTETITLTPDASTPLNSTLNATITATFGPSASPETQTVQIPVNVVVPGAAAIANASVAAGKLGNTNLADQLNDLSTALTNLVENRTSQLYMSQAQASLTAVIGLMGSDPYLSTLIPALKTDAATLAQATTTSTVQTAVSSLGNDLNTLGSTLSDEAAYGFTLTLLGNSQVGQPQVATTYGIVVQNTGSQTATYDLSLSGVPSGVTASLSQTSVTLAPGQATSVTGGVTNLSVTITSNSTTELDAFTFTVHATAEEATEISRTTTGSYTARNALVQVVSVTPDPAFTDPGGQVDVSAQILNAVNQQQQAEVSYTVTDPQGNVVFTSQPVAVTLSVLTTLTPVDMGNLDPNQAWF